LRSRRIIPIATINQSMDFRRAKPVDLARALVRLLLGSAVAAAGLTGAGGCATAAVASAGTMVGLAASAVSTGADAYRLGKLDSADEARYAEWVAAVHAAAAELHLKLEKESDDGKGVYRCTLRDDRGSKIKLGVERRTETLCRTRIDVGWFGSEPTARLLLWRIRFHDDPTQRKRTGASTQEAGK